MEGLGKRLKSLRVNNQLSIQELADRFAEVGYIIAPGAISKWENDIYVPKLDKLIAYSKAFNLTLDQLVFGDDNGNIKLD